MFTSLRAVGLLPSLPISARILRHISGTEQPLAIFPRSTKPQRPIGTFLKPSTATTVRSGALTDTVPLIDLEHVGPWGELVKNEVENLTGTRIKFNQDQLITTKLRPYLQKTILLPEGPDWHGSPEWLSLNVNKDLIRPKLLFYIFQNTNYIKLAPYFSTGKEHPRISLDILNRMTIPQLALDEQDEILRELDPLYEEAASARAKVSRIREAIDPYFEARFGLDPHEINPSSEKKGLQVALSQIAEGKDLRFSYRYHSPSVRMARTKLAKLSRYRLRELLSEPAVLGDSISPEDYDSSTGYTYASMVAVKRWRFETSELNDVSEEYYNLHSQKHLQRGDVVMARSGEGTIGKVGWVDTQVKSVCADFVIRIRPDPKRLLPGFLYFILMSSYYQHLVYGEKKGLGNNTNIFPNQLHDFPIIEASVSEQEKIVASLMDVVAVSDQNMQTAITLEEQIDRRLCEAMSR